MLSYRVLDKFVQSSDSLKEALSWGLKEFIDDSISVGMIALSDKGEGVGIANTDMPWSTWIGS